MDLGRQPAQGRGRRPASLSDRRRQALVGHRSKCRCPIRIRAVLFRIDDRDQLERVPLRGPRLPPPDRYGWRRWDAQGAPERLAQRRTSGSHATPPATWRATIAISRKAGTPTSKPGTTKSSNGDWVAAGSPIESGGFDEATGPAATGGEPVGFGAADADVPDDPRGAAVAGPGVGVGSELLGSGGIDGDTDGTGSDGTGSDGGGGGLAVGRVGSGVGTGGKVGTGGSVGGGKVGTGGSVGAGKVGGAKVGSGGKVGT
jgi:hypothetical protein